MHVLDVFLGALFKINITSFLPSFISFITTIYTLGIVGLAS